MNDKDDSSPLRNYEVGYGKPPKDTRFKKGHKSRGGRKKGIRNHRTLVREYLLDKLPMKTAHGTVHITCMEAIVKRALTDAALGKSPRAVEHGLRLIEQSGGLSYTNRQATFELFRSCWDTKIETTVRYLGVEVEDALALAEGTEV